MEPATAKDGLRLRLQQEISKIADERLPGWEAFFANDPKVSEHINGLMTRAENAIRDEDRVRFDKEVASISKAWRRLNELVAEAYRKKNTDPKLWELRYVKWMQIAYIKFDSPKGEFYLVPRTPKRKPGVPHWYTVDEMLTLVRPGIADLIKMSDGLPDRDKVFKPPGPGEQVIHIDATGPEVHTYCETPRRSRHG